MDQEKKFTIGVVPRTSEGDWALAIVSTLHTGESVLEEWGCGDGGNEFVPDYVNRFGRDRNNALVAVECNVTLDCLNALIKEHSYPNLYRYKYFGEKGALEGMLGWFTSPMSRPRLEQVMSKFKEQGLYKVSDDCPKPPNETTELAAMIALYCAHEDDYSEAMGSAIPGKAEQ